MVAGKKYMYLRNDEEMMCGKGIPYGIAYGALDRSPYEEMALELSPSDRGGVLRLCELEGQGGICIFKTGQALIIGTYNQDMSPANNTKEVGKMADYLKEVGY